MDNLITLLALTFGVIIIIYLFFKKENNFRKHGIPYLKPPPMIYDIVMLLLKKLSFGEMTVRRYNVNRSAKYIGTHDFGEPVIVIRDLDLLKSITVKNFDHFVDRFNFLNPKVDPLLGYSLFFLNGEKWRSTRNLLSPAFTSSKMKAMFELMSDCASNFTEHITNRSQKGPTEFDSKDIFTRYTNDTIATCAFGVSVDSMANPDNDFYVFGRKGTVLSDKFFQIILTILLPKVAEFFGVKVIEREVHEFFLNLVRETIKVRDEKGIYRPDMIQLMMESRNTGDNSERTDFNIENMTAQAFIFFFAGFETTSALMCFAAHEIAINPDIQVNLQREIDQVMERCDGKPTYEAINSMRYLEAVINEALRKYPPTITTERKCVKSFELPPTLPGAKPFIIEPETLVLLPIWAIHRDPEHFPEPESFIPERFLEDEKKGSNSLAYLPFGSGPRMCIGNRFALLETKVMFFYLFAKCNVKVAKTMVLPIKIFGTGASVTAQDGFKIEIQPRMNKNKQKITLSD